MQKSLEIYNETNRKLKALAYCGFLSGWDINTEMPPKANHEAELSALSEMSYTLQTSDEYSAAVDDLYAHRDELSDVLKHEIEAAVLSKQKLKKVPMDEYVEYGALLNRFYNVYVEAKNKSDFSLALPYYEKVVEFKRKYVLWQQTDELSGYDILLDEFEKGTSRKQYDEFFALLKEKLVPLIKKISGKKLPFDDSFGKKYYSEEGQKRFQEYLRGVVGFTPDHTVVKESEHPFTSGYGKTDVRITNHFYADNFLSSVYSAIHEMGHGMYEMQVSDEVDKTMSGGGASMAMHESQSRFLENIIGRSKSFWETHFEKLKEIFPENLDGVTANDLYLLSNRAECSLVRTEADELTYSLHIMVRYEIEKGLLNGQIEAKDIPSEWNRLYKEYLGIDVPSDKEGCLQDVHWACGDFGYFPTYALGSAYASQIYHAMQKDLDVAAEIRTGSFSGIEKWLAEKIHRFGASKDPKDILFYATGEEFNPNYYIDYLVGKYSKLYGLDA
ncbi:MAG: carboxypeptidase M32 [Eubacteriales bacterium]|jgi:carboxypeptidase Taq|nr:carboxypeptidase M32 [Eubacteriales bacterium]